MGIRAVHAEDAVIRTRDHAAQRKVKLTGRLQRIVDRELAGLGGDAALVVHGEDIDRHRARAGFQQGA